MFVLEYKLRGKPSQYQAIDEAMPLMRLFGQYSLFGINVLDIGKTIKV